MVVLILFGSTPCISQTGLDRHFKAGITAQKAGELTTAIEEYEKVLAIDPSLFEAHWNLALAYHQLERYEEAVKEYEIVLKLRPREFGALFNLGVAYHSFGKNSEAVNSFLMAERLKPKDSNTLLNLAILYYQSEQFERAKIYVDKLIRVDPQNAKAQELSESIRQRTLQQMVQSSNQFSRSETKSDSASGIRHSDADTKRSDDITQQNNKQNENPQNTRNGSSWGVNKGSRFESWWIFVLLLAVVLFGLLLLQGSALNTFREHKLEYNWRRAVSYEKRHLLVKALRMYEHFENVPQYTEQALVRKGIVAHKLGCYDDAIELLTVARDHGDVSDQILYFLSMSHLRKRSIAQGSTLFYSLLDRHPEDSDLQTNRRTIDKYISDSVNNLIRKANASLVAHEWQSAYEHLVQALRLRNASEFKSDLPYLRNELAKAFTSRGDRRSAIAIWTESLSATPPNYTALHNLAISCIFEWEQMLEKHERQKLDDEFLLTSLDYFALWTWEKEAEDDFVKTRPWLEEDQIDLLAVEKQLSQLFQNRVDSMNEMTMKGFGEALALKLSKEWRTRKLAMSYMEDPDLRKLLKNEPSSITAKLNMLKTTCQILKSDGQDFGHIVSSLMLEDLGIIEFSKSVKSSYDIQEGLKLIAQDNVGGGLKLMEQGVSIKSPKLASQFDYSEEGTRQAERLRRDGQAGSAVKIVELLLKQTRDEGLFSYAAKLNNDAGQEIVETDKRMSLGYFEKALLYDLHDVRARNRFSNVFVDLTTEYLKSDNLTSAARALEFSLLYNPHAEDLEAGAEWLAGILNRLGVRAAEQRNFKEAEIYFRRAIEYKHESVFEQNLQSVGGVLTEYLKNVSGVSLNPSWTLDGISYSSKVFKRWVLDVFRSMEFKKSFGSHKPTLNLEIDSQFEPDEMFVPGSPSFHAFAQLVAELYSLFEKKQFKYLEPSTEVGFNPRLLIDKTTESHKMFSNFTKWIYDNNKVELFIKV